MTSLGDMSTDRVIRNISHKLRHYLEVERREEGFVTAPKKRKDPKSTKSFSTLVHDRSMHHLFDSQQANRILAYLEENSRLSTREKQVRSELVQYMTNGEISGPKIVNFGIPKFDKTTDVCREKKRHEFLGSVPKAEAERLVTIATKLYVTTEMLLSNKYCQSNDLSCEEEHSTRDDTEEKATPIGEFSIPDLRYEKQSSTEEPVICEAAVNTDVEPLPEDNLSTAANDNLPTTKILKNASCQTEDRQELCEGDKDRAAESDIESGVHVFSNNSRTSSGNRRLVESSSSQSSDLSEDSNYCDETYSDEEDSSLCESSELEDEATGVGRITTKERPDPSNSEGSLSTKAKDAVPSILTENVSNPSDVESNSSETCSTCNSYTCSCNSCNEGSNVFVIQQSKEECSECSTCSCSCSSNKSANNENETGYEERGVTSEFNNEADINNNTVAAVGDQNVVSDEESLDHRSANEDITEEHKEETSKHPVISQITIESWDSQEMDEEAQILSIHEAARNGDLKVVELLSKANRKYIETVDERGWTPIHLAAANGHTEIVKFLALEGAHISALDPSGYTALHISAMRGHKDCMEALLEAEADIESVTSDGFTAFHLAALNNHIRCCKILLAWGASLKKEDALGRTVVDMAEEYSLKRVKRLIQNFHKQLDNINTIVDAMEAFSDKKRPKSEKPLPRNLLDIMTSVMTDEHSSD